MVSSNFLDVEEKESFDDIKTMNQFFLF